MHTQVERNAAQRIAEEVEDSRTFTLLCVYLRIHIHIHVKHVRGLFLFPRRDFESLEWLAVTNVWHADCGTAILKYHQYLHCCRAMQVCK